MDDIVGFIRGEGFDQKRLRITLIRYFLPCNIDHAPAPLSPAEPLPKFGHVFDHAARDDFGHTRPYRHRGGSKVWSTGSGERLIPEDVLERLKAKYPALEG
jgi:hypothetical protein